MRMSKVEMSERLPLISNSPTVFTRVVGMRKALSNVNNWITWHSYCVAWSSPWCFPFLHIRTKVWDELDVIRFFHSRLGQIDICDCLNFQTCGSTLCLLTNPRNIFLFVMDLEIFEGILVPSSFLPLDFSSSRSFFLTFNLCLVTGWS